MRAAIHNPYLDTLGGGERYTLTFAEVLIKNGWSVDLEWSDFAIKDSLEERFGMDLEDLNIVSNVNRGDGYDLCFWVSDGSIPALKARKNLLHFQVPFHDVNGNNLLNKMKLIRVDKIICNSIFTKKVIDIEYGVDSLVVYPPVSTEIIKPKRKEKIILSVGRFSQALQSKRQDVLVDAFKNIFKSGVEDWKLIIAGGVEVGIDDFLKKLEKSAEGYPIEIVKSPSFSDLKDLYGRAKIFWSASGFEESEEKNPEKVEHFGISVVEAMAAGAVPIIYNAGGHKEIVKEEVNGFLWTEVSQLTQKTLEVIKDLALQRKIYQEALERSKVYSYANFEKQILQII